MDAGQFPAAEGNAHAWRRWLRCAYYVTMVSLALAVVYLVVSPEEPWFARANLVIWAVFLADYLVRFAMAPKKLAFVRSNIPDLIAVIPFDFLSGDDAFGLARLLRLARFVALIRLMRAGLILWRASHSLRGILSTNGLGYILLITLALIVLGGVGVWIVEPEIGSIEDGIWWGLVTATTIGYGDIAPKTLPGRLIAAVLMVVGIGSIGMLTGSIATFFLGKTETKAEPANPHVAHVAGQLNRWDDLSADERRQLADVLAALARDDGPRK